jgi:hypothetical protein
MCDASSAVNSEGDSKKRPLQDSDRTDSKKQCREPDRVKKRKVALLLAYSGQGYLGMQRLVHLHQCNIIYHMADKCYRFVGLRPPPYLSVMDMVVVNQDDEKL